MVFIDVLSVFVAFFTYRHKGAKDLLVSSCLSVFFGCRYKGSKALRISFCVFVAVFTYRRKRSKVLRFIVSLRLRGLSFFKETPLCLFSNELHPFMLQLVVLLLIENIVKGSLPG